MIVFTARNKSTNDVFVGSARDSVEEQWGRLIALAEDGGDGDILQAIRDYSPEGFELETYDYADTPSEARELVRDASETLGAAVIRTAKAAPTKNAGVSASKSPSVESDLDGETNVKPESRSAEDIKKQVEAFLAAKKLKEGAEDKATAPLSKPVSSNAASSGDSVKSEPKVVEPKTIVSSAKVTHARDVRASRSVSRPSTPVSERRAQQKEHGPVTQVDISAYLASQAKEQSEAKSQSSVQLRKTESTQEAEDMKAVMMRIEMKRRQNRQSSSTVKAKPKPTKDQVKQAEERLYKAAGVSKGSVASKAKKDKLPDGRVSSSAKEKRIKEAIAQERMEREAAQAAKVAAEAKEMAEIMAKLDQRTKEKERLRRRR